MQNQVSHTQWAVSFLAGILLAGGAAIVTATQGDLVTPMVRQGIPILVITSLLLWSAVAWAARRIIVGKAQSAPFASRYLEMLGYSRLALIIACMISLLCGFAALVAGLAPAITFSRAVLLLAFILLLSSLLTGAIVNTMLVIREWRTP